jgi:hypothetical protein
VVAVCGAGVVPVSAEAVLVSDGAALVVLVSEGTGWAGVAGWAGLAAVAVSAGDVTGAACRARGFRGAGLAARAPVVSAAGAAVESLATLAPVSVGPPRALSFTTGLAVSAVMAGVLSAGGAAPDRCSPPQPTTATTRRRPVLNEHAPLLIETPFPDVVRTLANLRKDCRSQLSAR